MVCPKVGDHLAVDFLLPHDVPRAIVKVMKHVKMRTYSPNDVYGPLVNPLRRQVQIHDGSDLLEGLRVQCSYGDQST